MATNQTEDMSVRTKAMLDALKRFKSNEYYFTFEGNGYPDEEEYGHLGLFQPYFAEVNPKQPLGRPLDHDGNQASLLPIPKLLNSNCLDENQYPWNIICSGSDSLSWICKRFKLYQELNVDAYKAKPPSGTDGQQRAALLKEMSTVTGTAQQTSYP